jgi:hypothetical protein
MIIRDLSSEAVGQMRRVDLAMVSGEPPTAGNRHSWEDPRH